MKAPTLAYSELTGTIYICYGREKVDVTEQAVKMIKAVWCMEHLANFKKEIDEKSEIHSDGEFYIKNLDVKRIINKHLAEVENEGNR